MSEKMTAVFTDTRLLRAASWLGRKRAPFPTLSFTRNGDCLHVMGTTGYTLIEGDIHAEFHGWEDGEGKSVNDFQPMKQLARSLKRDNNGYPCTVEIGEGGCTVSIGGEDVTYKVIFTSLRNPPNLLNDQDDTPEGSALMNIDYLDEAVAVMRKMGMACNAWRVIPHGANKAMLFALEDAPLTMERNVRVLAMPRRED